MRPLAFPPGEGWLYDTGIDLLLAPPSPETAELVTPEHLPLIIDQLRVDVIQTAIDG